MATVERCDSCGRDDDDVVTVRRAYVTPGAWDAEPKVEMADELERWCFPCRTHYPHEEVTAGGDTPTDRDGG